MMDRRAFLGALAAAGLIPKTWAEDAPAVAPPVVADSDDFDDFGWGDDFDWEDDDLGLPPLPEPEPPPPPSPPVRSEGPDVLIVNGTEIRCKTFSWHREVHDWMDERGWMCHTVSSALDLEITSTDEATEKVAREAGRELTVGYRG